MKIHPDQLESVRLDQTTQTGRPAQAGSAFGDILSQEVGQTGTQSAASTAATSTLSGLDALGALTGLQSVEATKGVEQTTGKAVMDKVESVLDKWDQYAQNLQGSGNLKQAYGVLDDIDGAVRQLKGDNPDLAQQHPALQGMVQELEALSTTERIKFNRGDYSA